MRKFLEVLVDDDGKFHFSTDESFERLAEPDVFDQAFKPLLHDMTEFMWQNKEQRVSQAIRLVSMAEMMGSAQPYEQAEEFWDMMMFSAIPHFENYAAQIKIPYGFKSREVTRPWTLGLGTQVFPIKQPFGKKMN